MKKRFTVNMLAALAAAVLAACGAAPGPAQKAPAERKADSLPLLQPRRQSRIVVMEAPGAVGYDSRNRTILPVRVTGRVEKLHVRYNYQPVRKGQLILEIYSPELVAAQREMLAFAGDPPLEALALRKLELLGMPGALAREVLRSRQVRVLIPVFSNADGYILESSAAAAVVASPAAAAPSGGDGMGNMGAADPAAAASTAPPPTQQPVMLREGQYVSAGQDLFTIYKTGRMIATFALPASVAASVRPGSRVLLGANGKLIDASVDLLEPVFANGEKFSRARVYLSGQFAAGQLLTAYVPVHFREGWWAPASAVVKLGRDDVVFRHEGDGYKAVPVRTGARAGGMVQLLGEVTGIAANAAYIADSEGFIWPDTGLPPSHP